MASSPAHCPHLANSPFSYSYHPPPEHPYPPYQDHGRLSSTQAQPPYQSPAPFQQVQPGTHEQKMVRPLAPSLSASLSSPASSPFGSTPGPISNPPRQYSQRGNITPIACDACRQRKSKCNGEKPVCAGCRQKGTDCVYTMSEDDRSAKTLRANLDKVRKELQDIKELLPLIANSTKREEANFVAAEIAQHGFTQFDAGLLKGMLGEAGASAAGTSQAGARQDPYSYTDNTIDPRAFSYGETSQGSSSFLQTASGSTQIQTQTTTQFDPANPSAVTTRVSGTVYYQQPQQQHGSQPSGQVAFPSSQEASKPLRSLFTDDAHKYKFTKRNLIARGMATPSNFAEAIESNPDALFFNEQAMPSGVLPSRWSNEIITLALPEAALPEKLASSFVVHMMFRFILHANKANKDALPEYLQPVQADRVRPYPMEVNFIPWPRIRAYLIMNDEKLPGALDALKSFSVNWTDTRPESMVQPSSEAGRYCLTRTFENHIRQLDNWHLSSGVLATFPEWQGMAHFT